MSSCRLTDTSDSSDSSIASNNQLNYASKKSRVHTGKEKKNTGVNECVNDLFGAISDLSSSDDAGAAMNKKFHSNIMGGNRRSKESSENLRSLNAELFGEISDSSGEDIEVMTQDHDAEEVIIKDRRRSDDGRLLNPDDSRQIDVEPQMLNNEANYGNLTYKICEVYFNSFML